MDGLGTDEQTIIDIICNRSNDQRQEIAKYYEEEYNRNLISDIKSEISGHFEDVIVGLLRKPKEFLCEQLYNAMAGAGTDENTLIEIFCSRSNVELRELTETYDQMYNKPLVEDVVTETSGDFRRLLTYIVTCTRDEGNIVDTELAQTQANDLYNAGEGKTGTDEAVFTKILSHENFDQLREVFLQYETLYGHPFKDALESELSGDYLKTTLAIVKCVESIPAYFAKCLYEAMAGAGTDDESLICITVSRSEIDLVTIKEEFLKSYGKTLESMIKDDTSGDYERALIALIS